MVEFFQSGQEKQNKAASGEEKLEYLKMTFTGTLIDDLMAAVERAEQRAQDEPLFAEPMVVETWFSIEENRDYDSKFLGVA